MVTPFFYGNVKEILKYALSLDTKLKKQNYLQDVNKCLDEHLSFLEAKIQQQKNNEHRKYFVGPEREGKVFYKEIRSRILKLLTAIDLNPNNKTDELLEQELRSLEGTDGRTNHVSDPCGYETQNITPGFKVIRVKDLLEAKQMRQAVADQETRDSSTRRQTPTSLTEEEFCALVADLADGGFIAKKSSSYFQGVYRDNFAFPAAPCGESKINWLSRRKSKNGGWGAYKYFYDNAAKEAGLFSCIGGGPFFAAHCLFDGVAKTPKQAQDGWNSAEESNLEDLIKESLNSIIGKYRKEPS